MDWKPARLLTVLIVWGGGGTAHAHTHSVDVSLSLPVINDNFFMQVLEEQALNLVTNKFVWQF